MASEMIHWISLEINHDKEKGNSYMATVKKRVLVFLVLLLIALTACVDSVELQNPTSDSTEIAATVASVHNTTEAVTTIATISTTSYISPSTILQLPLGMLQTRELRIFYEEYKLMMLELTRPLIDKKAKSAAIYSNFSEIYYTEDNDNEVSIAEEQKDIFRRYFMIAEAETGRAAAIHMHRKDDKQIISFSFGSLDFDSYIIYMPDGYVKPFERPNLLENETKLTENWYSYYIG